jgi:hypothetical protein
MAGTTGRPRRVRPAGRGSAAPAAAFVVHLPGVVPAMTVVNRGHPLARLPALTTTLMAALTGAVPLGATLRLADNPRGVLTLAPAVAVVVGG